MKAKRILLPIDIAACPVEVFEQVNGMACQSEATIILLHVVNLNILSPENRIYTELCQEAYRYLELLARHYLVPTVATVFRVRLGRPEAELLVEAKEQQADVIVLPVRVHSGWKRWFSFRKRQAGLTVSRSAKRIIRESGCEVVLAPVTTSCNCVLSSWLPLGQSNTSLEYANSTRNGAGNPDERGANPACRQTAGCARG